MLQVSRYSSINFDNDWKLSFQIQADYCQKFATTDKPRVQYVVDSDSLLNPYLSVNGQATELQPTTLSQSDEAAVKELVIDLSSIPVESEVTLFFAENTSSVHQIEAKFLVTNDIEYTVLIEYTNRRNEYDTIFDADSLFQFRVEGSFLPQDYSFESQSENFRDQRHVAKSLSGYPIEKKTLSIGGGFGVPRWVASLINNIFSLSSVYVNGEKMVRDEGGSVEMTLIHNDYPLYIYKITLETSDEIADAIISLFRAVDSKKKVARSSGDGIRVYNEFAQSLGISDARMIRELATIEEISKNFYIEIDDGSSTNTGKANLATLQRFIFDGWIDQPVRTIDNVKFKSVEADGFHSPDFIAGMTGTGVGTVNGAELHADKLLARKYIEVLALVVAQMFYRGGRQVLSPAGMKVSKVEEREDCWRLWMETGDGQVNAFTVGAQARVNRYGAEQRYWWRLVTAVGADYIDVSKADCDEGSVAPAIADEVVQMGHRTDPQLQWCVMDSSFSEDAGRTIYAGIDSYTLDGKLVLREGVDPNDPGRIGLFLPDGTEISTVIGDLQQQIDDFGEGLRMEIDAEEGNLVIDGEYDGDLVATVWRQWKDITSTVTRWVWTRQSGTDTASLASDALWNDEHAGVNAGRINIQGKDIVSPSVKFVCDATVGDATVRGVFG